MKRNISRIHFYIVIDLCQNLLLIFLIFTLRQRTLLYIINQNITNPWSASGQKTKNAFLDPKKTFLYKTYEKNFVRLKKFAL